MMGGKWIACSDRMPPLKKQVEVLYAETGETDFAYRYQFMESDEQGWDTWKGLGDPTHWRFKP